MSYHVLHVLTFKSHLSIDKDHVVCTLPDGEKRCVPLEDVRAVVVAAKGVNMTPAFLSAITAGDAVILHCNEQFQPCGITTGLVRTVDRRAQEGQMLAGSRLHAKLWAALLRAKTANQMAVLSHLGQPVPPALVREAQRRRPNESLCAREYWKRFFSAIGYAKLKRERRGASTQPNQMLNYGYAVASALCHRALLAHGLAPPWAFTTNPASAPSRSSMMSWNHYDPLWISAWPSLSPNKA